MVRILTMLTAAVVLAACATAYQPSSFTGGFETLELRPDAWRITFSGNGYTTKETAQTYWLYRSADLALEKGYDGFEILSDMHFVMDTPHNHFARTPGFADELAQAGAWRGDLASRMACSPTNLPCRRYARGSTFVYIPGGSGVAKPAYEGDIHLLKRPFTGAPPKVFDARALKAAIDPYLQGEKCGVGNICPHVHEYLLPKGKLQ